MQVIFLKPIKAIEKTISIKNLELEAKRLFNNKASNKSKLSNFED